MRKFPHCRSAVPGFAIATIASMLFLASSWIRAEDFPRQIDDLEFWRLVTELSEPGGTFPQQYMSNEDSAQFVIPALKEMTRKDGVYIGVGLEQNFTYVAAVQPRIAFIVDIRRDNLIEHLMYKALFELSADRADFLSRLFSRKRPSGLNAESSTQAIFDAYRTVDPDSSVFDENLRVITDNLVRNHKLPLSEADKLSINRILNAFRVAGPGRLRGQGDATNPTYAQLMTATDLTGRNRSYLASEDSFKILQELERQNRIIPVVGNFAGDKAIVSIGRYLREHSAVVDVFYVSNVERYLFEQGDDAKHFYANVAALPLDPSSTFIRSVTSDISRRLGIPIPDGTTKWRSFLSPVGDYLKAFTDGRIQTYLDVFGNL